MPTSAPSVPALSPAMNSSGSTSVRSMGMTNRASLPPKMAFVPTTTVSFALITEVDMGSSDPTSIIIRAIMFQASTIFFNTPTSLGSRADSDKNIEIGIIAADRKFCTLLKKM